MALRLVSRTFLQAEDESHNDATPQERRDPCGARWRGDRTLHRTETRNLIVALLAAGHPAALADADRAQLASTLARMKRACAGLAVPAGQQRHTQQATFWKAASVYCGHIARAARTGAAPAAAAHPPVAAPCPAGEARKQRPQVTNPLLRLEAADGVGKFGPQARAALAAVLAQLAALCRERAERDLLRHKASIAGTGGSAPCSRVTPAARCSTRRSSSRDRRL